MAFRLKPDETLTKGVRRLVKDQIDKALDSLTGQTDEGPEEVVHGARRRFKKVRAVLRLARFGLGRRRYAGENAKFRDLGRPLSEVRDAEVLVEAFDGLMERFGAPGRPEAVNAVRSELLDRKQAICRRVFQDEIALEASAEAVQEARRGVKRWKIDGDDRQVLEAGLKRIYRKGYRAAQTTLDNPTDFNLHECRKRVKDLYYVLDILRPIPRDEIEEPGPRARELAEALGKDHDLAVLRQLLSDTDWATGRGADVAVMLPLVDRRRSELQEAAMSLMREVYGEKPRVFVTRLGKLLRARKSVVRADRSG